MHINQQIYLSKQALRKNLCCFIRKCFATINPGTQYQHNWHIELIAAKLAACEQGDIKRLIINIPPRHLKSITVNVAWPAWLLGHDPTRRVISASYSQALATKHSLDTRLLLGSPWYNRIFPQTRIVNDQNEKDKFVTTKRGFRLATSVGGTLTGEGGNFLILDDPHNPAHLGSKVMLENTINWYQQVFATRLDDKNNDVIVLIMQRLHVDDLTGFLTRQPSVWDVVSIPARSERDIFYPTKYYKKNGFLFPENSPLHAEKENLNTLKAIETELGSHVFSAQYLQNPLPVKDGLINSAWLKYYKILPANFTTITQSWDTAIKIGSANDYSVCTTWGETENGFYLIDVFRDKLEYPSLKRKIINLAEKFSPDSILIEDKASGQSLLQDLKNETKLPLLKINPALDKITRLASVSATIEAGRVFLPESSSWLVDLEMELLGFPNSANDDMVDSTTQFLNWAKGRKTSKPNVRNFN